MNDAMAESSALKKFIVWYQDTPTAPWKIDSPSPLSAAKDFALRCLHRDEDIVVCVRDAQQSNVVHKCKRSAGMWSTLQAPSSASPLARNNKLGTLTDLVAQPPKAVKMARQIYIVWLWVGIGLTSLLAAAGSMGNFRWQDLSADVVMLGLIIMVVVGGFGCWFTYWTAGKLIQGKQWARVVVIVFSASAFLPSHLFAPNDGLPTPTGLGALLGTLVAWGFAIWVICLLAMKETSDWFRKIRLLRDQELLKTESDTTPC